MEINEKNNFRIFFISLFESFNGGNGKSIALFGRVGGNGMDRKKHLFLSIYLKSQIFILPKLRRMGGNEIRFNDFFTKIPKIPLYIQPFILK